MKEWSKEEMRSLLHLNKELLKKTGINFIEKLADLANNDKKTELDCHEFIKKNYPVKTGLSFEDHRTTNLLLRFYLQKLEEHDSMEESTYSYCEPKENPYDKPFRSRFLRNFLTSKDRDPTLVTGFFPKD